MIAAIVAVVLVAVSAITASFYFGKSKVALDPERFKRFTLIKKTEVSPDTHIFRFSLHHEKQVLGLPIGQHIMLRALCNCGEGRQEMVSHSYTPISSDDEKGYVDFMIKVYFANVHPKFPHGGRLSQHLYHMSIGQQVEMRGPKGKFEYLGNGRAKIYGIGDSFRMTHVDAYAMVAGGTGITPMLQLIRAIHKNKDDKTKIYLVYGNQTEKDILLRKELDELVKIDPKRIYVWYTIDRDISPQWLYGSGYVTEEMLRAHLPVASNLGDESVPQNKDIHSVMALMCGPPPMLQYAVRPNLEKIGYTSDNIFSF